MRRTDTLNYIKFTPLTSDQDYAMMFTVKGGITPSATEKRKQENAKMKKVLEYKTMMSGWKQIMELYPEATDEQWITWARQTHTEVRVRTVGKEVA